MLRPGGQLGLLWNIRDERADWVAGLGAILRQSDGAHAVSSTVSAAPRVGPPFGRLERRDVGWVHHLSPDALVDMVSSRSYVSTMPAADHEKLLNDLRHLMRTHPSLAGAGEIALPYVTRCWRTRLRLNPDIGQARCQRRGRGSSCAPRAPRARRAPTVSRGRAEEALDIGGLRGQRRLLRRGERPERVGHHLAAGDGPERGAAALDEHERAEQPIAGNDRAARRQEQLAGGPAEQQRVEGTQQAQVRHRGLCSGPARRSGRPGWPARHHASASPGAIAASPRRASPSGRPAHLARSRSAAGACPAR